MNLRLQLLAPAFSVCKVATWSGVDFAAPFVFAAATDAELSLVCPTDRVPSGTLAREDGWRGLRVVGCLDFSLVGILARLTGVLADAQIPVFAVSTFDTDYLLLKADLLDRALAVLAAAGFPGSKEV